MTRDAELASLRAALLDADSAERGSAASRLGVLRDEGSIELLADLLSATDRGLAESAEAALIEIGGPRVAAQLAPLLRSEDLGERNRAAHALARLGDASVPVVRTLVSDPDPDIRLSALEILLKISSPGVLQVVTGALGDTNVNVATAAARALGELGMAQAAPHLARCPGASNWLACAAATSLGQIGGPEALRALLSVGPDAPSTVRYAVINALGQIGDPSAVSYLQSIAASGPKPLSAPALEAIVRILDAAYDIAFEGAAPNLSLDRLTEFLRSDSDNTVLSVAKLLGRIEGDEVEPTLARLLVDDDTRLVGHVTGILLKRGVTHVRPFVRLLDDTQMSYAGRKGIVKILGASGSRAALEALMAHLRYGDPGLRIELVHAIAKFDHGDALDAIILETSSSDEFVRCAVADVLDPTRSEVEFECVSRLLGDPSPAVRMRAIARCEAKMNPVLRERLDVALASMPEAVVRSVITLLSSDADEALLQRVLELADGAGVELIVVVLKCLRDNARKLSPAMLDRARALLEDRSGDPDERIRIALAKSWPELGGDGCSLRLVQITTRDASTRVRYEAALAMKRCPPPWPIEELLAVLDDLPALVQTAVAETLAASGDERASSRVEALAQREVFAGFGLIGGIPNGEGK